MWFLMAVSGAVTLAFLVVVVTAVVDDRFKPPWTVIAGLMLSVLTFLFGQGFVRWGSKR